MFTRADDDKEFLARGRWSSTHHPFTAPMAEDVEKLLNGEIKSVSYRFFFSEEWASGSGALDDIVRSVHLGRNRAKGWVAQPIFMTRLPGEINFFPFVRKRSAIVLT